jgi:hypothetical protein
MINKEDFDKALDAWIAKISPDSNRPQLSPEQQALIKENLGYCGQMLSGSKQPIRTAGRSHLMVWNGNLVVEGFGKVWYGDIDVTRDEKKIKKIALGFKSTVYVLREMDARFETENNPQIKNAVYITDGLTSSLGESVIKYYQRFNDKIYMKERE